MEINDTTTADLCLMAALRWLTSKRATHINGVGGAYRVFVHWGDIDCGGYTPTMFDGEPYAVFMSVSLDTALFDACEAIAKDEASH